MDIPQSNENYLKARGLDNNNQVKKFTMNNNNPEKPRPYRRIFGQDITNITSLTEHQANDNQSSFFQAFKTIQENQAKHQKRSSINNQFFTNASILETEKQIEVSGSIPQEIRPIITRASYDSNQFIFGFEDKTNPQVVPEYQEDIRAFYMEIERSYAIDHDYMRNQSDINDRMREILIDWLVEVHIKFKLVHETLFLAVNIIDRYLSMVEVNRKSLQLVGVTALFIACKYEEIYPPDLRHFTYITDNAYEKRHVLQMESDILKKLKFDLSIPSSLRYLELFYLHLSLCDRELMLSKYLLELALMSYKSLCFSPGILAASAMSLAIRLLNKQFNHKALLYFTSYANLDIANCSKHLYELLLKKRNSKSKKASSVMAVYSKYSSKKYMEIALLAYDTIDMDQVLA